MRLAAEEDRHRAPRTAHRRFAARGHPRRRDEDTHARFLRPRARIDLALQGSPCAPDYDPRPVGEYPIEPLYPRDAAR